MHSSLHLKKSLGQHFLHDENMLRKIASAIGDLAPFATVVEIGPGMGALTKHLLQSHPVNFYVIELDDRWAAYLPQQYPLLKGKVIHGDFLKVSLDFLKAPVHVVGNFPYNISSQIVFRILEENEKVTQVTGMFQKEVALRIAAGPGSKDYGILSVLTQAYYQAEYLFDVSPQCFNPPPKVMSGIIRLRRKEQNPDCDMKALRNVVKTAFNQRRKTMRNSLRSLVTSPTLLKEKIFDLRPEQLSLEQFIQLTKQIQEQKQ